MCCSCGSLQCHCLCDHTSCLPQRDQGPWEPRSTGRCPHGVLQAFPGLFRFFPRVTISAPPGLGTGRKKWGAFLPAEVETPLLCGSRAGMPASHPAAATRRKSPLGRDLLGEGAGAACSLGREEPSVPRSGHLAGEPAACHVPRVAPLLCRVASGSLGGRELHTRGVTHILCSWTFVGKQNHAQELKHLCALGLCVTGDSVEVSRDVLAYGTWWRAQITQNFP